MSGEGTVVAQDAVVEQDAIVESTPVEEKKLSPAEEKALSSGWMPQDEWEEAGNDVDDWVDARTFNRNGEFMNQIHRLKRQNQDLSTAINDLKQMQGKTAAMERKKVMAELKQAKVTALENEDHSAVVEIDEKMAEVKDMEKAQSAPPKPQIDPNFQRDFDSWQSQNDWYGRDEEMRNYADFLGTRMAQNGAHYSEVFREVSKKVRETFPNKFENPARNRSTVDGGNKTTAATRSTRGKSKIAFSDLPAEAQETCKRFERLDVMSRDDFLKDYAKNEGL